MPGLYLGLGLGLASPSGGVQGLDLDFVNGRYALNSPYGSSFPAGWSFSRTGGGTALDLAGNAIQFATGVPRITNRGLLVEEGRTNLALWSRDFTNAVWNKISGATAPDANTVSLTASVNSRIEQVVNIGTGQTAVWQVRLSGTGNIRIAIIDNGGAFAGTPLDIALTATPTAYSVVRTIGGSGLTSCIARITTVSGAAVTATADFADIGIGSFPTSPIITTGAAGTRGPDTAALSGLASLLTPPFTTISEWESATALNGFPAALGGTNFIYSWSRGDSSPQGRIGMRLASPPTDASSGVSRVISTTLMHAVAFDGATAQRQSVNGQAVATASLTLPAQTLINIGRFDSGTPTNGYIRRIRIIPRAVNDAELQALTSA
jgi:hypothetical protein